MESKREQKKLGAKLHGTDAHSQVLRAGTEEQDREGT